MLPRSLFAFATILLLGTPAAADEVRMEMRNQSGSERFVYEPDFIRVSPGDTVVFVPIDKGHNAISSPSSCAMSAVSPIFRSQLMPI